MRASERERKKKREEEKREDHGKRAHVVPSWCNGTQFLTDETVLSSTEQNRTEQFPTMCTRQPRGSKHSKGGATATDYSYNTFWRASVLPTQTLCTYDPDKLGAHHLWTAVSTFRWIFSAVEILFPVGHSPETTKETVSAVSGAVGAVREIVGRRGDRQREKNSRARNVCESGAVRECRSGPRSISAALDNTFFFLVAPRRVCTCLHTKLDEGPSLGFRPHNLESGSPRIPESC